VTRARSRLRQCPGPAIAMLCVILAGGAAAGCAGKPYLSSGDANSAAVGYSGNDPAVATAVAKDACARYERVPRFLNAQENVAYFACEHP
jgi:hypothetical protein